MLILFADRPEDLEREADLEEDLEAVESPMREIGKREDIRRKDSDWSDPYDG